MTRHPLTPDAAAYLGGLSVPRPGHRQSQPLVPLIKGDRTRSADELAHDLTDMLIVFAIVAPLCLAGVVVALIHH